MQAVSYTHLDVYKRQVLGHLFSDLIKVLVFSKMKNESVCDKVTYKKLVDDLELQRCV